MALETLRANKLQSGLTVLGVVIGITSIVGSDVADSWVRSIDSREHQRARADHHLPGEVQRAGRLGRRLRGDHAPAQPHR